MYILISGEFALSIVQVEEVEGQVVIKADKRDLLRGRRAPAVLQVSANLQQPFLFLSDPKFCIPYSLTIHGFVIVHEHWGKVQNKIKITVELKHVSVFLFHFAPSPYVPTS